MPRISPHGGAAARSRYAPKAIAVRSTIQVVRPGSRCKGAVERSSSNAGCGSLGHQLPAQIQFVPMEAIAQTPTWSDRITGGQARGMTGVRVDKLNRRAVVRGVARPERGWWSSGSCGTDAPKRYPDDGRGAQIGHGTAKISGRNDRSFAPACKEAAENGRADAGTGARLLAFHGRPQATSAFEQRGSRSIRPAHLRGE